MIPNPSPPYFRKNAELQRRFYIEVIPYFETIEYYEEAPDDIGDSDKDDDTNEEEALMHIYFN